MLKTSPKGATGDNVQRPELRLVGHQPQYVALPTASATVAEVEAMLADWFAAPVVLTSSGRSAMLLLFEYLGLDRYRDRIALPRMISACVLDAVIRRGFPVDAETGQTTQVSIVYHQFGVPQKPQSFPGRIMEDICHAFFASPDTGSRPWWGEFAVFSLPKFFQMQTMVGGLVLAEMGAADRCRAIRDSYPESAPQHRDQVAEILRTQHKAGSAPLQHAYLDRLIDPRVYNDDLAGIPGSITKIRDIGRSRKEVRDDLLRAIPRAFLDHDWYNVVSACLPFVLPIPGDAELLARADRKLAAIGIAAGVYRLDINRTMSGPRLVPALLIPCHHLIAADQIAGIQDVLSTLA